MLPIIDHPFPPRQPGLGHHLLVLSHVLALPVGRHGVTGNPAGHLVKIFPWLMFCDDLGCRGNRHRRGLGNVNASTDVLSDSTAT